MELYRKTYAEIDLGNIKANVKKVISKFNNYDYYFGVVKADCYGHNDLATVKAVIDGGANYLAVATLEEALVIREEFKDIPILCLGIIPIEYIKVCCDNNITITVSSLKYAKDLCSIDELNNLKVHLKINSGMNRLGIALKNEFDEVIRLFKEKGIFIEGVYTHIFNAKDSNDTKSQFDKYNYMVSDVVKEDIPIFHVSASDALVLYEKGEFINGCRLGIVMYGFTPDDDLKLCSTFKLCSEVIQINELKCGDKVGYNGLYVASGDERIAVVPIGYADGIIRKNTGRGVYINDKEYPIVGNICMDMLFVKIDDSVNLGDEVLILKDAEHIEKVADYLETIPYEVMCEVGKRVPRLYVD